MISYLKNIDQAHRLIAVIAISLAFFLAEISVGFHTASLALIADASHYLNDLMGFVVALVALKLSRGEQEHESLSFGWKRIQVLGAFFNGVFLLALGLAILLQSFEKFASFHKVEDPVLMLIMGCIGFFLNIICVFLLHDHSHHGHGDHEPDDHVDLPAQEYSQYSHQGHRHLLLKAKPKDHDLGMLGVLIHVIGDAINNIGVIIAATVIWKAKNEGRYYADPGVSIAIAIMIAVSAIPLVKNSGMILLESVPVGVKLGDIKHDLEKIEGIVGIRDLHAWRLNQSTSIASAHVLISDDSLTNFLIQARHIKECLHSYGIHSATVQPELVTGSDSSGVSKNSLVTCQQNVDLSDFRIDFRTSYELPGFRE